MKLNKILKSDLIAFFLFLILIYSIFRYAETFNKGFNINEDQFIVNTYEASETKSFTAAYEQMLQTEIAGLKRFRPVYLLYAFTTVKLFGIDLLLINIYLAFLFTCTSFLLFKFCFNIGFTILQSFLFSLLTVIGPPTIMWIRPPDSEIIGMLTLSLSLFFLSKSIYSNKHQLLFKSLFIFSLFLAALSKESFLITIPAVLFLYIWLYSSKNNISFIQSIKKNYPIIVITLTLSVGVLLCIIKFVGINPNQSYTGVDVNLFSSKTFAEFINTVFNTNIFLVILFGVFILIENGIIYNKLSFKNFFKNNLSVWLIFIFMFLFIFPQLILYYKTGFIGGRYYLPYLLGFSFTVIYLLKLIFDSKLISPFIKNLYLTSVIAFVIIQLITTTIPDLTKFSNLCRSNTEALMSISKNPNKELLIVMDPVQNYYEIYPIQVFLNHLKSKKKFSYDFIKLDFMNKLYKDTSFYNTAAKLSYKNLGSNLIDSAKENSEIGNILIYNGLGKKFLEKNKLWFKESQFEKKQLGYFTLYLKQ